MKDKNQLESLLNRNRRVDFIFELPGLSPDENQLWHKKIKKNYYACGCNTGKTFVMYAFVIISVVLFLFHFFKTGGLSIMLYVYCFLFLVLMAGLGKAVGKIIAYKNLERDIDELKSILN